jgi:hypothetical protein
MTGAANEITSSLAATNRALGTAMCIWCVASAIATTRATDALHNEYAAGCCHNNMATPQIQQDNKPITWPCRDAAKGMSFG